MLIKKIEPPTTHTCVHIRTELIGLSSYILPKKKKRHKQKTAAFCEPRNTSYVNPQRTHLTCTQTGRVPCPSCLSLSLSSLLSSPNRLLTGASPPLCTSTPQNLLQTLVWTQPSSFLQPLCVSCLLLETLSALDPSGHTARNSGPCCPPL